MCPAGCRIKLDGAGGQASRVVRLIAAAADSIAHIEVALVWSQMDMARQGQCSRVFRGVPVYFKCDELAWLLLPALSAVLTGGLAAASLLLRAVHMVARCLFQAGGR